MRDVAELKQRLAADFEQIIVDLWKKRLQAYVKAKGQHFEQLL